MLAFQKMVIAIAGTGTVQGELYQAASRRREFYQQLGTLAGSRVAVYQYNGDLNSPWWFHSKTWIFDDEFALVSSANCNRRSYTNDSEIGLAIRDPTMSTGGIGFAKALRIQLWLKHLNAKPAASGLADGPSGRPLLSVSDVLDFASAAPLWDKAPLLFQPDLAGDLTPDIPLSDRFLHRLGVFDVVSLIPVLASLRTSIQIPSRDLQWSLIDPSGN